jgi:hypothetical protein
MNTTNWQSTLIRCSSLSSLFTEPQAKADKEAGKLSATAKAHLIEVYARELWGVEKDIVTKAMQKGIDCEEAAITLLSRVDKRLYVKNMERMSNDWISGHADIIESEEIIDTKVSFDAFTFLPKLTETVNKNYEYQCQGYMWLYNRNRARISYCLVDTPEYLIEGEKWRLLRAMDVISEDSPEFKKAFAKIRSNMIFSQIPPSLRVINHFVERDEEIIAKIPSKVLKAREFLIELHEKHLSLYKTVTV